MAHTRFGFTLALTFLALIAALLASVKAAPSGLQSRDDEADLFASIVEFDGPFISTINGQPLSRGESFLTNITVTQVTGSQLPFNGVVFRLFNVDKNTVTEFSPSVDSNNNGTKTIALIVPADVEAGTYSLAYKFNQSNSFASVGMSDSNFQIV